VKENKLIGDNADAPGFLADLNGFLGGENMNLKEKGESALVLGAGGSARAIIYALLNDGWKVTVAARRIEQADELARSFPKINVIEYNVQTFELADLQLIVNTTPVGMTPNIDQSPWPENLSFPSNATIYDLVYNPRETKLVKDARAAGLSATTGLGMLIEQAMIGFEIWTGKQIPREIMSSAVEEV
jgi:shikimate dehydrogenase